MTRKILNLSCLASFAALAFTSWRAATYYGSVVSTAKEQVLDLSLKGAARIDAELRRAMAAAQNIADDLSSSKLPYERIDGRLKDTLTALPFLRSVNVAFEPGAYKPGVRLYTPYWVRDPDGLHPKADPTYDYTRPEILWFARAVATRKPVWVAPYYRKVSNTITAVYAVPFFKNGKVAGVLSVSLSLDEIRRMVETLDLGPSGFGELISADGTYLYHPRNEYVLAKKTIFDIALERGDKDRLEIAPKALRGEGGIVDHISTNTGLRSWFIYEPIPSAGWSLQNTFVRADLPYDVDVMRHKLVRVMLAFVVFLLILKCLFFKVHELGNRNLWALSILSSVLFAGGVAFMWMLALKLDVHERTGGTVISDRAGLARLVDQYTKECAERHAEHPIFVPTGVFLETARFIDPSDVQVTGYIWQKYDSTTKGLDRGIVLRDAADVKLAEPYRQSDDGAEVLRWPFQAVLHQNMHIAAYPLDQETISLQLRHVDLDHNVVLTPDLGSYKILAAAAKPGLAPEFNIPGWRVLRTFFGVAGTIDNTTFGLSHSVAKEDFPGLQYDVLLRRNLLDAFISNLGPIIISLILLFALQMVMTSDEKLASYMQTTAGRLVAITVSMFFVIVFAHINVRRSLAAEEIFYLEHFYFTTYLMILWVAINSIAFVKMKDIHWLQYDENVILKLMFWPVVTGLLFISSVATFY
jgi:hypothetical protein